MELSKVSTIETLKAVQAYFERNNGGSKNIQKAKTAIEKARKGRYTICPCKHIPTTEEINRKPFNCSECGQSFI